MPEERASELNLVRQIQNDRVSTTREPTRHTGVATPLHVRGDHSGPTAAVDIVDNSAPPAPLPTGESLHDAVATDEVTVGAGGRCPEGSAIREVRRDGTLVCEYDDDSGGDITGITTLDDHGLTGGCDGGTCKLGLVSCGPEQLLQSTPAGQRCTDAPKLAGLQLSGVIERELDAQATVPDPSGGTLFRLKSRAEPSSAAWTLGSVEGYFAVPYSYMDKTLQLGYNYDGAQRQNLAEPAVFMQFEHSYQHGDQFGEQYRVTELHLSGQDLNGREHRYFSNMSSWDGSWGLTMVTGTVLKFSDWAYNLYAQITRDGFLMLVPLSIQTDAAAAVRIASLDNSSLSFELARTGSYFGSSLLLDAGKPNALDLRNRSGDVALRMFAANDAETSTINMGSDGRWNFIHEGLPTPDARMQFLYNTGGVFFIDPTGVTALQLAYGGSVIVQNQLEARAGMRMPNSQLVRWSGTSNASATPDVALGRRAPGLLEVNSGTAGSLRDLSVRHLVAAGSGGPLACGDGAERSGDDTAGSITAGANVTSCTLTFATEFAKTPTCVVSSPSGKALAYTRTKQQLTVSAADLGGTSFDYICMGH